MKTNNVLENFIFDELNNVELNKIKGGYIVYNPNDTCGQKEGIEELPDDPDVG